LEQPVSINICCYVHEAHRKESGHSSFAHTLIALTLKQEGNTFHSMLVLFNCLAQYISREADRFSADQRNIANYFGPQSPLLSLQKLSSHCHLPFVILVKFANYIATIRTDVILASNPLLPKRSLPFMCEYYGQNYVQLSHLSIHATLSDNLPFLISSPLTF